MNDWTKEIADGYEANQQAEQDYINRKRAEFAKLEIGQKVLFWNSAKRLDEWATIAKIHSFATFEFCHIETETGRKVYLDELKLVHAETKVETLLICLNDRIEEFRKATARAADSQLEVFPDWEKDNFVVVNRAKETEYHIIFKSCENQIYAACECPDFKHRNRVCKHITAVLRECFEPLFRAFEKGQTGRFYATCEFGNYKRQHSQNSAYFNSLGEAIAFVERSIGTLQGHGAVYDGEREVWAYQPEYMEFF